MSATSSLAGRRAVSEQDSVMEYGPNRSATRFELSRHVEIARICLRQVGNQVCDQVCDLDSVLEFSQSRSHANSRTSSRAGSLARLRSASELDSVIEFGMRHAHDVHTQVFVQLASRSRTSWNLALTVLRKAISEMRMSALSQCNGGVVALREGKVS